MAPTLYYTLFSPPVRTVLLTAKNIGLEMDLKELNILAGEQYSEEFLKINPQHSVPTLVDDDGDFVLSDSHAIALYLIEKYAEDDKFYPNDAQKRAKIHQRMHFDTSTMYPVTSKVIGAILMRGQTEITDNDKLGVQRAFELLNTYLSGHDYMVDDSLTVADFCMIPIITSASSFVLPIDEGDFPNLYSYVNRMMEEIEGYEEINTEGINQLVELVTSKMEENKLEKV